MALGYGAAFGAVMSLGVPHLFQDGLSWGMVPFVLFFMGFFAGLGLLGWGVAWVLFDWRRKRR